MRQRRKKGTEHIQKYEENLKKVDNLLLIASNIVPM